MLHTCARLGQVRHRTKQCCILAPDWGMIKLRILQLYMKQIKRIKVYHRILFFIVWTISQTLLTNSCSSINKSIHKRLIGNWEGWKYEINGQSKNSKWEYFKDYKMQFSKDTLRDLLINETMNYYLKDSIIYNEKIEFYKILEISDTTLQLKLLGSFDSEIGSQVIFLKRKL